jgi:hypothetical protein
VEAIYYARIVLREVAEHAKYITLVFTALRMCKSGVVVVVREHLSPCSRRIAAEFIQEVVNWIAAVTGQGTSINAFR